MSSKSSFLFLALLFISAQVFSQIDHWETTVYAEDDWNYFIGVSEPPQDWTLSSFDDSGWLIGQGGIGYGDQDDNTIISATESVYMRRKFTVVNLSAIESVLFHADFDDGFVAYLNGIEIARTNMEGSPPAYNSWATQLREAQMYSGGIPQEYNLSQSIVNAALIEGENVLTIQTHNFDGLNSSDLTTLYWLSLGINDQSANYGPTPSWFVSPAGAFSSNLPIVTINTELPIQDDPKVSGEIGIIWNGPNNSNISNAEPTEYLGNIAIEYRGQSSSWFPKRGYSFETRDALGNDLDTAFLNFPAEEDWILHGPYSDKSLIRNVLAMEIATRMGQYASRTRQVELVVNGSYEGIYILMEKIKRDKNRVDIANLRPEDIAGDELTGGYVFKVDKGVPDWLSQFDIVNNPGQKLSYQYVSPNRDNIQPAQASYIQGFMNDFENSMLSPSTPYKEKYYYQYMDLKSFADHFIISEITRNVDGYRLSTYMHKDKDSNGGLLKAGPIWDYNLGFGNADYCFGDEVSGWIYEEHCDLGNPFWWEMLFQEERFWNTVKCRWDDFRSELLSTESLSNFIDSQYELLSDASVRNFSRWPILDEYVWPNPVVTGSYESEIENLKRFLSTRMSWMDDNIIGECIVTSTYSVSSDDNIEIYPNPSSSHFRIVYEPKLAYLRPTVRLIGLNGFKLDLPYVNNTPGFIDINYKNLEVENGIYFVELLEGDLRVGLHKIFIQR